MNWPNRLTLIRICLVPVMIVLFYLGFQWHYAVACVVFILASVTDILDGAIARGQGIVTKLGKLLDPMADKLLICSALILLSSVGCLHPVITIILIVREFAISAFRLIAAVEGVVLAADRLGKFKTIFQSIGVGFLLLSLESYGVGPQWASYDTLAVIFWWIGTIAMLAGTVLAVWSCVNYMLKNKQVFKETE